MVRVKSKFHRQDKPKSIETVAEALGFNGWKIAKKTVDQMYSEGFNFNTKAQILDVVGEFVAFMIQIADRLAYERMSDENRQRFITAMASRIINTMVESLNENLGEGDYKGPYIEKLNQRLDAYSEYSFADGQPSYQALRYFGKCVDEVMGGADNKWVIEQVIEVESPQVIKTLTKNMDELLAQADLGGEEGEE